MVAVIIMSIMLYRSRILNINEELQHYGLRVSGPFRDSKRLMGYLVFSVAFSVNIYSCPCWHLLCVVSCLRDDYGVTRTTEDKL